MDPRSQTNHGLVCGGGEMPVFVSARNKRRLRPVRRSGALWELLESRVLLSSMPAFAHVPPPPPVWSVAPVMPTARTVAYTTAILKALQPKYTSPNSNGLMASQIRSAYGITQVLFGSTPGDGTGQTVAIIDAYHYPTALNDVNQFSATMGLASLQAWSAGGNTGPWLRVYSQTGVTTDPAGAGNSKGTWEMEEALDIQWVHAIAPAANIILVEAADNSEANLLTWGVGWARTQPGVSAISMSFSGPEFSGQTSYDYLFTTPAGHTGITSFAATGDTGKPSGYPAYSPNVVAVGGTTLSVSGSTYISESGWSGSGGGLSTVEAQPSYQTGVVTQSTTQRANPDVAMNADPASGVWIYDSWDWPTSPWQVFGGTSLATPMWAGIMAIVNQGRVLSGLTPLDGRTQTLPKLYTLPASDFHDITTGNNGFAAGTGYDLVTGRGSPVANLLIADLVTPPSVTPGVPALDPLSDTGVSNTDKITSRDNSSAAKALTFTIGGTVAGATVSVFADGNLIGSALAGGTTTSVTSNGTYTLASGTHAITATQTQPGLGQSPASAALTIIIDTTPVAVTAQSPSGSVAGAQSDLKFTFNEAIDTTSFTLADVTSFTDPSANDLRGQITGFTWSAGNTVLDILFNTQSAVGTYQMTLGPQILDIAGNAMAGAYTATFGIISTVYAATMDANPGWTFDAGSAWAWGAPAGLGSHNHDPASGHTGTNVVGYNLAGDYAPNVGPYYAATPAINCANYQGLTLSFWRWLGVRSSAVATVQASSDGGTTWTTLWTSPTGSTTTDAAWSLQQFTLPSSFNGQAAVKFRWGMGPTGGSSTYPGWNIDDVTLAGAPFVPPSISGQVFVDANGNGALDAGEAGIAGTTVFLDLNGNGVPDTGGAYNFVSTNVPQNIPDNNPAGVTSALTATGTSGMISNVTLTFNITHTYDSDLTGYLIGPDGTQITLFSGVGGSGANFATTTLSDAAATAITSGVAPFNGTYRPSPGTLASFAGKSANGKWLFKVVDSVAVDVGTINNWSLAITTLGDPVTTTDGNGNYRFNVAGGTYTVRQVPPANYVAVAGLTLTVNATAAVTGQNFADFPTTFGTAATGGSYYLTASAGIVRISAGNAPLPTPTYQIAANLLPGLTFNFTGANETLFADFTGGAPGVNITLNSVAGSNGQLTILGTGTGQVFTMTDYQIGLAAGGGIISYNNVDAMDLLNCTVNYSGSLATLRNLTIDSGCVFYWG